jgi:hypothetical protein
LSFYVGLSATGGLRRGTSLFAAVFVDAVATGAADTPFATTAVAASMQSTAEDAGGNGDDRRPNYQPNYQNLPIHSASDYQ